MCNRIMRQSLYKSPWMASTSRHVQVVMKPWWRNAEWKPLNRVSSIALTEPRRNRRTSLSWFDKIFIIRCKYKKRNKKWSLSIETAYCLLLLKKAPNETFYFWLKSAKRCRCRFMLQLFPPHRRRQAIIISEAGILIGTCFLLLLMGECIFAWTLQAIRVSCAIDLPLECSVVAWLDSIKASLTQSKLGWKEISIWKRISYAIDTSRSCERDENKSKTSFLSFFFFNPTTHA